MDKTAIKVVKMDQSTSDFAYWQTRSFEERLHTLETIIRTHPAETRI